MAIEQNISAIPLLKHRDTVVTVADQDEFVTKYEATNDFLSGITIPQLNVFATQANALKVEMNTQADDFRNEITVKSDEISVNVEVMSGYVATTQEYSNEALGYENATETLYNDTVTLLEDVDIGGTSGYTIDAVDDMFTRQRNSQFVGLT